MWLLVGQAHSPHTRLRLAVSPEAALIERHWACPPQPLLYKDFITWPKERFAMSPGSPARSGLVLDDMHIAAVAVVTESSSSGPVAEESGRGLWRGLTRAGRGGASGSRGAAVVVAGRAGTVDRGAHKVTRARVVEEVRDIAIVGLLPLLGARALGALEDGGLHRCEICPLFLLPLYGGYSGFDCAEVKTLKTIEVGSAAHQGLVCRRVDFTCFDFGAAEPKPRAYKARGIGWVL